MFITRPFTENVCQPLLSFNVLSLSAMYYVPGKLIWPLISESLIYLINLIILGFQDWHLVPAILKFDSTVPGSYYRWEAYQPAAFHIIILSTYSVQDKLTQRWLRCGCSVHYFYCIEMYRKKMIYGRRWIQWHKVMCHNFLQLYRIFSSSQNFTASLYKRNCYSCPTGKELKLREVGIYPGSPSRMQKSKSSNLGLLTSPGLFPQ